MNDNDRYANSAEFNLIKITVSKREKIDGSSSSANRYSAIQVLVNASIGAFFMGKAIKLLVEIIDDAYPMF